MAEYEDISLSRVQAYNWLLLALITAVGCFAVSSGFAAGILVGGIIANCSFTLLKNDLLRVMAGPLNLARLRFFIKYYARLMVLVLIMFFLVRHKVVNTAGLLIGLSTVVISIGVTATGAAKKIYFTAKEA